MTVASYPRQDDRSLIIKQTTKTTEAHTLSKISDYVIMRVYENSLFLYEAQNSPPMNSAAYSYFCGVSTVNSEPWSIGSKQTHDI